MLTGKFLDLPDVRPTGYVDLADPRIQGTSLPRQVRRQRINDNLLGGRILLPIGSKDEPA